MTEIEHACIVWALGSAAPFTRIRGEYTDGGPAWDFDADASLAAWARERQSADERIGRYASLDAIVMGNGRSVRWSLQKIVGEYARHNGHADLLRERIDGQTGE